MQWSLWPRQANPSCLSRWVLQKDYHYPAVHLQGKNEPSSAVRLLPLTPTRTVPASSSPSSIAENSYKSYNDLMSTACAASMSSGKWWNNAAKQEPASHVELPMA
jgi:hypothetical protein